MYTISRYINVSRKKQNLMEGVLKTGISPTTVMERRVTEKKIKN
jgi:hypothetical protein